MKDPKFYTKDGWLTPYSLACGYMEVNSDYSHGPVRVRLEHNGGIGYDVRVNGDDIRYWEIFETLTEARKDFSKQLKQHNLKRYISK